MILIFSDIALARQAPGPEIYPAILVLNTSLNNYELLENSKLIIYYSLENIETNPEAIARDIIIKGRLSPFFILNNTDVMKKYFKLHNRDPASMEFDAKGNFLIRCSSLYPNESVNFQFNLITKKPNGASIIEENWSTVLYAWWDNFKDLRFEKIRPVSINSNINEDTQEINITNNRYLAEQPFPIFKILALAIPLLIITILVPYKIYKTKRNYIKEDFHFWTSIYYIFNPVHQKEDRKDEANSKTLVHLNSAIRTLLSKIEGEIHWLDIGCGDGRCLEVIKSLDPKDKNRINIHGVDINTLYENKWKKQARGYGFRNLSFSKEIDINSRYDVASAILLLHEIDPLILPSCLRDILTVLKEDGQFIIADFDGPYETENDTISWDKEDIQKILETLGAKCHKEPIDSRSTKELKFYRMYVHKGEFTDDKYKNLADEYGKFLEDKRNKSLENLAKLEKNVIKKLGSVLGRSESDLLSNFNPDKMSERDRGNMNKIEDETKAQIKKIIIINKNIVFITKKINELQKKGGII